MCDDDIMPSAYIYIVPVHNIIQTAHAQLVPICSVFVHSISLLLYVRSIHSPVILWEKLKAPMASSFLHMRRSWFYV